MQLRNKIYSYFLLGVYLIVLISGLSGNSQLDITAKSEVSHQHEDFNDAHHDHHFHIGIFHVLGHLFDSIKQSDSSTDQHLVFNTKTIAKDDIKSKHSTDSFNNWYNASVHQLNLQSQSDPPGSSQFLFHRFKQPNFHLRGPPTLV